MSAAETGTTIRVEQAGDLSVIEINVRGGAPVVVKGNAVIEPPGTATPWTVIVDGDASTLPGPGDWLVTVDTDSLREVHVLTHEGKGKWRHEGEFTFQHGYYFHPIAWAARPEAYAGEVPE